MCGLKRAGAVEWLVVFLVLLCYHGGPPSAVLGEKAGKVEYIRLPLLTLDHRDHGPANGVSKKQTISSSLPMGVSRVSGGGQLGKRETLPSSITNSSSFNIAELLRNLTGESEEEEEEREDIQGRHEEENESRIESVEDNTERNNEEIEEEGRGGTEDDTAAKGVGGNEDDGHEEFNELDLIELVQELEHQADMEEQTGIFPEILDILHGKQNEKKNDKQVVNATIQTTSAPTSKSYSEEEGISNITLYKSGVVARRNGSLRISLNEDGDFQLGSEDLSQFSEEIVEGISEGIEESLRMSDDLELDEDIMMPLSDGDNATTRQFSVYLFQGQYYAEPRLNRFIDGAIRNMGTELKVASMDPLYFRVLPRGLVVERDQPLMGAGTSGIRRRRPGGGAGGLAIGRHILVKRQLPAFFKLQPQKKSPQLQQQRAGNNIIRFQQGRRKPFQNRVKRKRVPVGVQKVTTGGSNLFFRRKRQQQRLQQQRKRRLRLRQQRLKQQLKNRRKKLQQNKKNQKKVLLNRIRRRIRQDVGGGRIEGLSRVQRDGDAEMQLFGNYTLIRSHMKIGPVEITMQFRTKNGIRRSGATLPVIRAHTVTRVNHEGSEMIDYLLDRPHPESIRVRGTLFPMAQKVARTIFARLFLPNSFLVSRLREKATLAFLSRPVGVGKR